MFTGLIEHVGFVATRSSQGSQGAMCLGLSSPVHWELQPGDSVAIDGVCLTVTAHRPGYFEVEAATETLERTTIGNLAVRQSVNLERAMQVGARLDGHLVSGHTDGVGTVLGRRRQGSAEYFRIQAPGSIRHLVAAQGSVTLAGVSLTVTQVQDEGERTWFEVAVIPHTLQTEVTTLGRYRRGDDINVEADLVARYLARMHRFSCTQEERAQPVNSSSVSLDDLARAGW